MKRTFSKWYKNFKVLMLSISELVKNWYLLNAKGQKTEYEILQTAHRLEKGLTNDNPKTFWGWGKALRLAFLLKDCDNTFASATGSAVLHAYLEIKKRSQDGQERQKAMSLEKKFSLQQSDKNGGVIEVRKECVLFDDAEIKVCERLFYSRHSVRDFIKADVKKEDIYAAIQLAQRAPSACNRQSTKVYVLQENDMQSIILTCDVQAFCVGEFNDWIVSTSIYAGYLSLALHLYGIGSCIIRKPLYMKLNSLRAKLGIPNNEKIVIELRFGYYKDAFKVAVSNRMSPVDVIGKITRSSNGG